MQKQHRSWVYFLLVSAEPAPEPICCPACAGRRLNPTALAVRLETRSIADFTALSVVDAEREVEKLRFGKKEEAIARE